MTIPVELIVCLVTALGAGVMALLSITAHIGLNVARQLRDIGVTLAGIDKRNALEDERHSNLARDVSDIQARLDRKGVLA
jgi:hypothetical protein